MRDSVNNQATPNLQNNIVLSGESIDFRNSPLGINKSLSMVPVNGNPIIGWILDDLLSMGLRQATVVLNESNSHFYNFER